MDWLKLYQRALGFVEGALCVYLTATIFFFVAIVRDNPNSPRSAFHTSLMWLPSLAQRAFSDE